MRIVRVLHTLILLLLATSCQKEVLPEPVSSPMGFAQVLTRAYLSAVHDSFKVYACRQGETDRTLMDGYKVSHDALKGWDYQDVEGQELQYWDLEADAFRFHGGAPYEAVGYMGMDSMSLSLSVSGSLSDTRYYTEPVKVSDKSLYGQNVALTFRPAHCRVQLLFKLAEASTDSNLLTEIRLLPSSPSSYPVSGKMGIRYDWNDMSAQIHLTPQQTSSDALDYGTLTLEAPGTSSLAPSVSCYYLLPGGDAQTTWEVSLKVNSELRTAQIPAGKAVWEAGKSYVYSFSISTRGDEPQIALVDTGSADWFTGSDLTQGGIINSNDWE